MEVTNMGFAKIQGNLTSRIGCRVRFGAPRDVHRAGGNPGYGTIIDEVWAYPEVNDASARASEGAHDWGDYSFCSQLIRWDDGADSIRLAYYRRRAGEDHWEFASQMTVNSDPPTIKVLLERTLAKQKWFTDTPNSEAKFA
jgi:hypothetical protein